MAEQRDPDDLAARRVVSTVPGMEAVAVRADLAYTPSGAPDLLLDVYTPPDRRAGERRPAVLFVHGGPVRERPVAPKDRGQYTSWGRLVAAVGLAGVTFTHRHLDWTTLRLAAGDVEAAVAFVRRRAAELGLDPDRLALWTCSGGPMVALRRALRDAPPYLRCLVSYYGGLDLRRRREALAPALSDADLREFSPLYHLEEGTAPVPPLLLARAGLDRPGLNDSIDRFVAAALARNVPLTLLNHPAGRHGFDLLDDVPRTHEIIRTTLAFLRTHLDAEGPGGGRPNAAGDAP